VKRSPIRSRSLNSLSVAEAMAQKAFNAYVRARDYGSPCISCGKMTELQAGHYRSVGAAPELRFDEMNVHGQCHRCNVDLGGNRAGFRVGIAAIYGQHVLDSIDGHHPAKHYTVSQLKDIRAMYSSKAAELIADMAA